MSPFEQRKYTSKQIKKAGNVLKVNKETSSVEYGIALDVLINFRALHYAPLNTFQATLRKRLEKITSRAIVAQRIKRLPTILDKLQRYPEMQLNRMQDIGGIRAIVESISELNKLHACYINARNFPHELIENRDYISSPKSSGYRGYHLVYKYHNKRPNMLDYEGLRIEIQMRTHLQHIWATAVETFEAFLGEHFKSSQGDELFLDFFKYVSSAFAIHEKQPVMEEHRNLLPTNIYQKIHHYMGELGILERIKAFSMMSSSIPESKSKTGYGVLILDTHEKSVIYRPYPESKVKEAYESYYREEARSMNDSSRQVVLVKADSIQKLKKAYPNYFVDLASLRTHLEKISKMCSTQGAH